VISQDSHCTAGGGTGPKPCRPLARASGNPALGRPGGLLAGWPPQARLAGVSHEEKQHRLDETGPRRELERALGFANGPPNQAGRDWLAGLGPVQEDTIGPAPESPGLGRDPAAPAWPISMRCGGRRSYRRCRSAGLHRHWPRGQSGQPAGGAVPAARPASADLGRGRRRDHRDAGAAGRNTCCAALRRLARSSPCRMRERPGAGSTA
jgi:hypothetical protein